MVKNKFGSIDASGVRASSEFTNAQGSIEARDFSGQQRIENSFGSISLQNSNGNTTLINSNGSVTASHVDGNLAITNLAGTFTLAGTFEARCPIDAWASMTSSFDAASRSTSARTIRSCSSRLPDESA